MTSDIASTATSPRPESGLGALVTSAIKQPFLSPEEELDLASRAQNGDPVALDLLIKSHLRFVVAQAKRYAPFGVPVADLVQEGSIALTQAVRRFNPEEGVRLATYARQWVRNAMQDYSVRNWSLVRVGAGARQRRLFVALRKMAADLRDGADALWADALNSEAVTRLARQFEVPAREVMALARRIGHTDLALSQPAAAGAYEDADDADTVEDTLADDLPTPEDHAAAQSEHTFLRGAIGAALAKLDPRERLIVDRRHFTEAVASFATIGRELGLSKERVRVLEKRAMDKLRAHLEPLRGKAHELFPSFGAASA